MVSLAIVLAKSVYQYTPDSAENQLGALFMKEKSEEKKISLVIRQEVLLRNRFREYFSPCWVDQIVSMLHF